MKILIVNACGSFGGDNRMLMLGLPFLTQNQFQIYCASIPRGDVYQMLKTLPNTVILPLELGGKELALPSHTGKVQRVKDVVHSIIQIAGLVRKEKIDAIYTLDRTISMGISYVVSLLTGCPLIFSAHIWHYLQTSRLHRMAIHHAACVTVTTKKMQEVFSPYVQDEKRIVVLPNAIQIKRFDLRLNQQRAAIRDEFGIPVENSVIALVGRLSPYKGQDDFIRAAEIIHQSCPNVTFLIVGSENVPGYREVLRSMIAARGLESQIRLIDHQDEIARIYACADIIAMPSHEEPFGLVALEAMAMEKPVVATRAGGVPEFLPDGEAGYLIEPHDFKALAKALRSLIQDPQKAHKMGQKGRKIVETAYAETFYGQRVVNLFSEFLEEYSSDELKKPQRSKKEPVQPASRFQG
jgi:glycosyltransferase involved in cell wall biosynthesis